MASDKQLLIQIVDQLAPQITITYKSMFGEYGIYADGKFVGAFCDNLLYIKPTQAGKVFITDPVEAPPYPGAKNYYLIGEDFLENTNQLAQLIRLTAEELPLPKKKKSK
ncbi:MAG: TfoX/Sxy family protein [Saprospiraceae bacterium]|nr:TfoX/Sxy family protein [Saprospiraceae bacterium]